MQDILKLFPAVIAPALVAQIRRRYPSLDGLRVWPVVVLVAILLTLVGAFVSGPLTMDGAAQATRDGIALGMAAIGLHYLARGKEQPAKKPEPPESDVSGVTAVADPKPDLDWGKK